MKVVKMVCIGNKDWSNYLIIGNIYDVEIDYIYTNSIKFIINNIPFYMWKTNGHQSNNGPEYFIPLAEFRESRINKILNE